ncbi:GNAT family N-acetyltransferase [Consotaella salsifontis]|uniref:Ribosomal protein S18 acetylase RimI n=1 Tax=Consotaella salsifontis TaxID=1365950 RepID=A0A1T4R9X2_9HYPH|nr:GNAT family N-acetyltransferase [Consotaella salsifontis]SKA12773.1 Ribosomal protein S18 acetylase RimI [Consotaella salsifontis]
MQNVEQDLVIRPATEADEPALFDICLRTADAGKDGTELFGDPRFPGYLWSVPYARFEPDFAFVLANRERAIGYVLAVPDTRAFFRRLEAEWWPFVRRQVADFRPTRPMDEAVLARIAEPEGGREALLDTYPAHLHINILADAQAGGWGRRLIETELATLRERGVPGVHLGVMPSNEKALGFYRHLGFEVVARDNSIIFAMKFDR